MTQLSDIAPYWAKRIDDLHDVGDNPDFADLRIEMENDISEWEYCIAGEAHGYDPTFVYKEEPDYCEQCVVIGNELAGEFHNEGVSHRFDDLTNDFVKHFEEKHRELIRN